jgi:hypothetical protein
MSDWRTLEAGRELDRVVAERLGWRVAKGEGEDAEWWVARREGTEDWELITQIEYCDDVDAAWIQAFRTYEGCDSQLPLYSRDANAALPGEYVAWQERGGWYACYEIQAFSGPHDWTIKADTRLTQSGDTLAEARIKAWLAWSERGA